MEKDPSGKDAHAMGAKLDQGKNRLSLIFNGFAHALWAVGEVATFGAQKYTPNGWREVEGGIDRYTDALDRHRLKEAFEDYDTDSELLHAAHLAWNALARLELMITNKEVKNANDLRSNHGIAEAAAAVSASEIHRGLSTPHSNLPRRQRLRDRENP